MRKAVALKFSGYFAFTLELASHRISSVIHKTKGSRVLMRTLGLPAVLPAHPRCVTLPARPRAGSLSTGLLLRAGPAPGLERSSCAQLRCALLLVNN